ncbi:MAG: methionine synthase, partial [Actinobacteria bacterium]|nr:methionine synthase [Actinomycetota bacterium]
LHTKSLDYPVLIGGAAINRDFGLRALYPFKRESDEIYEPGVFYCKDAFEGLNKMDQLIEPEGREALLAKTREAAEHFRKHGKDPPPLITDDDTVRSAARTDLRIPTPPFWGAREIDVPIDDIFPHLDTHVLFKLHWGGRGVKGEAWRKLLAEDFQPRLERMWREQDYLHPRALLGYFPCYSEGNEVVVLDPDDRATVLERLVFPRQPAHHRICLADFFRPKESGEIDVVALQAVTVGPEVTEVVTALEQEGEFAEQLFTHGLGVQSAEGTAEWLHSRVRSDLGIGPAEGRRYSWGYPACPEQSEHEKVYRLLDCPSIGLSLTGGFAVEPEQSTLAIVAHHPQAVYFGMKSGFLPKDKAPDDIIAGSDRDATVRRGDIDPREGPPEDEPALVGDAQA